MARYEFVEGTSSKFWEIELAGSSVTTRYGRIGGAPQETTKPFPTEAAAKKEHDKLVAEKTRKGYVLASGGGAPATPPAPASPSAPPSAPAAAPVAAGVQRFELVEGTSSKFWEVRVEGARVLTTYGKIGASGQSTDKAFADEAAARRERDKLVAEKTKKGYQPVGGGAAPAGTEPGLHRRAGTAFRMADLEQLDGMPDVVDTGDEEGGHTFMGLRYGYRDPDEGLKDAGRRAWRIPVEADSLGEFLGYLEELVDDPAAGKIKALVLGNWGEELATSCEAGTADAVTLRDAICAAAPKLSSLAALFVNDVGSEECEVSWQNFCDVAPILVAYPDLQHLRVRGNTLGAPGQPLRHARLRSLQLEGSNLSREVFRQVSGAELPALEHLELWLGPEDYNGGPREAADLAGILDGTRFPALRYLGLRNSDQADVVAQWVAASPLVARLEVLDLSLGNLGDAGAEALIASPAVARLEKLDVRHHYVSDEVLARLKALRPVRVVESRSEDGDDDDDRYVAVGE